MSLYDRTGVNNGQTAGGPLFGQGQRFSADSAAAERLRLEALEIAQRFQFGTQEPTQREDGSPLQEGDVYTHTVTGMEGIFLYDVDTSSYLDVIGLSSRDPRLAIQATTPTASLIEGFIWINTSGAGTPTLNIYDGSQFQLVESENPTGDEIIAALNLAGVSGTIDIDRLDPDVVSTSELNAGLDTKQDTLNTAITVNRGGDDSGTIGSDGVITLNLTDHQGTPIPHARLRASFSLSTGSVNQPTVAIRTVTGTPSAAIVDGQAGDVVTDIVINSAHVSRRDSTTRIIVGTGNPRVDTMTWNTIVGETAGDITFTCVFTVNYAIGGTAMSHQYNMSATFRVIPEVISFFKGTISQAVYDQFTGDTTPPFATIAASPGVDNIPVAFNLPYTSTYSGSTTDTYAMIMYIDTVTAVNDVTSQGIAFTDIFSASVTDTDNSRTYRLFIVNDALTNGDHSITWR